MINYNHFITWEMLLNKRSLSKIKFLILNRLFVRAIFSCMYILFVNICLSMASDVLIYFSQVLMLPSYPTILVYNSSEKSYVNSTPLRRCHISFLISTGRAIQDPVATLFDFHRRSRRLPVCAFSTSGCVLSMCF